MKYVSEVFLGLILSLDTIIYSLITSVFKIFMALSGARLLTSEAYYEIANKVYAIIGVVMLFVLAYSILRGIVNPDQAMKESGGGLVKRIIIAVIGLAITPVLFNVAYQGQSLFLEHDVLSKIFFRGNSDKTVDLGTSSINVGDQSYDIDSTTKLDDKIKEIGGAVTATNLWQAFFYPAEDSNKTADEIEADPTNYYIAGGAWVVGCAASIGLGIASGILTLGIGWLAAGAAAISCFNAYTNISAGIEAGKAIDSGEKITLTEAYTIAAGGGPFGIFTAFIDNLTDGEITYKFIVSTIAGAFALYAFASFSFDMGIRAAKLAYFQIIAPIPLIMQVIPKYKDNFKNYVSSVISTFAEVFIRISVVYIVVYIICHLGDLWAGTTSILDNNSLNGPESILALALLILGLIAFARKAPEFISETLKLPKGSMSLGIKNKLAEGGGFALAATGMGAAQSAAYNFNKTKGKGWRRLFSTAAGFGSGLARGAYQQFRPGEDGKFGSNFSKGFKEARESANKTANNVYDASNRRDERREERAEARQARTDAVTTFRNPGATQEEKEKAFRNAVDKSPVGRVIEGVKTWSTPTVDTSKMDAEASLYGDIAGLKGKLEAKVETDTEVINAKNRVDDLARQSVVDYAYSKKVEDEANDLIRAARAAGRTMTLEEAKKIVMNDQSNPHYLSRANFVIDAGSQDYLDAERTLNGLRADAAANLKAAKKEAVTRKLAEASLTGLENDVSIEARTLLNEIAKKLSEVKDAKLRGQTALQYLSDQFGSGFATGQLDFENFLKDLYSVDFGIELSGGNKYERITNSTTGAVEYFVTDSTGRRQVASIDDLLSELKANPNKTNITNISRVGSTGKMDSRISDTKDEAEQSDRKLRGSAKWAEDHRKQRAQQEKNKK